MQASFLLHRKKKWNGRLDLPACDIKGGQRFPLYPSRQWNIYLTLLHPATTTTPLPPEKYQSYLLLFRRRRSICGLLFCGEERQVQKGRSLQRKSPSSSFSLQLFPCPFLSCLLPSRPSSNILLCSFLTQLSSFSTSTLEKPLDPFLCQQSPNNPFPLSNAVPLRLLKSEPLRVFISPVTLPTYGVSYFFLIYIDSTRHDEEKLYQNNLQFTFLIYIDKGESPHPLPSPPQKNNNTGSLN